MFKKLTSGSIAIGLIIALYFFATQQQTTKADNVLTVGMMEWPPLMTTNAQGEVEGFDVDVARELATRMNKKMEIINLGSLPSLFVALNQGKIDIIFSGLDITEQRLKKVAMVHYTGAQVTSFSLLFWKQLPLFVESFEDLRQQANCVICTEPGSAQEKFLDQCSFVTKKTLPTVVEMVMDIKFGKSLAFLVEPRVARRLMKVNPELIALEVPLPRDFQVYGEGLAIKKNQTELTATVSNIIGAMKQEGILQTLEKRWNLNE